ncbi:MAG: PHB depolymerase family esterase [Bacteroidota bacterium]|nr:PHB depolymerase family esterase [Bacteroidota bacterium]
MKNTFTLIILLLSLATKAQLTSVASFGSNPGNLNMYKYVPSGIVGTAPLVVVMHGCTQTAQQAADQTGWNKLADLYKFYVVYPEQKSANNAQTCFNWFLTADQDKDQGENLSIKQMVDQMKTDYTIDNSKVFATGLSAGAAMTEVVCATYPEVYSGGAVMAGGPYKAATTAFEASAAMNGFTTKTPAQWAALVTAQNPTYTGAYPKMVLFHGTMDPVVNINNLTESIKQWTALHNTDDTYDGLLTDYAGNTQVVMNSFHTGPGTEVVRSYIISGFGHAIAVDTGSCPQQGGQTATYSYDINFHSTYHAAKFFGLIDADANTLVISGSSGVAAGATSIPYSTQSNVGSTYDWKVPVAGMVASGQGSSSILANFGTNPGYVAVHEITPAGCLNGPEELWVNLCTCVGIEEMSGSAVSSIYSTEYRNLVIKGITEQNTSIRIYDLLGNEMFRQITSDESVSLQLPESISAGVYVVEVSGATKLLNKKIIIR